MTGLDLATDALVEIAVLVTDSDLNIIGEGVDVVIHATQGQLDSMNDFVHSWGLWVASPVLEAFGIFFAVS